MASIRSSASRDDIDQTLTEAYRHRSKPPTQRRSTVSLKEP